VFERLPQVFPEFGWRHDAHGWVATNYEHTKAQFGVRADRVVAHALPLLPRGLYIHGEDRAVLWTEYLNGGIVPRGADFVRAVKEIAERAGVDPSPLDRAQPRDPRADLLQTFFDHCQRELASERGERAREYLEGRGFPRDAIEEAGLGLVPAPASTRELLERTGYGEDEIRASGIVADSRWPGRLCGAWRDDYGRVGTLWVRALDEAADAKTRYLYLRGAARTNLPPYGLSDASSGDGVPAEIVVVEGLIDVHHLRARGIESVAALGGTSMRPQAFERLARRGIEAVTFCLDNDDAGRGATARAVEQSAQAESGPTVYVIDPEDLAPAKDPDELVRKEGAGAWRELLAGRTCGIEWRARELAAGVSRESPAAERRAALGRAGQWLGTLPPRLALEQEDALRAVVDRCGYSTEAAMRAFRVRFWAAPDRSRQPDRSRNCEQALER
jgi:DNA primase